MLHPSYSPNVPLEKRKRKNNKTLFMAIKSCPPNPGTPFRVNLPWKTAEKPRQMPTQPIPRTLAASTVGKRCKCNIYVDEIAQLINTPTRNYGAYSPRLYLLIYALACTQEEEPYHWTRYAPGGADEPPRDQLI